MSALNDIFQRFLQFAIDASERHPRISELIEPLTKTANLDLFLSVLARQPQALPLIEACKNGDEACRKKAVTALIDQMLLEAQLIREVDLVDAAVDLDKLARYLVLWSDVVAHR